MIDMFVTCEYAVSSVTKYGHILAQKPKTSAPRKRKSGGVTCGHGSESTLTQSWWLAILLVDAAQTGLRTSWRIALVASRTVCRSLQPAIRHTWKRLRMLSEPMWT